MDIDYQNFVERMGSFEDSLDLTDNKEVFQSEIPRRIVTRNRGALTPEELKHFGIPGMKWGHHKAINANTIGAAAKLGQNTVTLGQTVNKHSFNNKETRQVKNMSDDELKKLTTRLNLENNYINARQQQNGRSRVEGLLSVVGSTLAVASSAAALYSTVNKK